ncbi:XRE family transcriptional regulator, partial [Streptomyces sp. ST1020]
MPNERLRAAMAAGGWTYSALADTVEVDPKSVERWVNLGRTPRRATALAAAETLGEDVHALWPALRQPRPARAVSPELVALYDQRADVPVSTFVDMLTQAREHIDVLVYAAVFLHEAYPRLNDLLRERAADGCVVRIAIGDPDSTNVQQRGTEEK